MFADTGMAKSSESVGARVGRAMAARGMGYNELDRALGYSEGYSSRLVRTDRSPRASTLAALAEALRVNLTWLATGQGPMDDGSAPLPPSSRAKVLKDMPGWAEAFAAAALRWKRIPIYAWEAISTSSFENPPERVTPELLLKLARTWLTSVSDEELAAAEESDIRRVMAEEDAAYASRMSPNPPMITTHPGPKAEPKKKIAAK